MRSTLAHTARVAGADRPEPVRERQCHRGQLGVQHDKEKGTKAREQLGEEVPPQPDVGREVSGLQNAHARWRQHASRTWCGLVQAYVDQQVVRRRQTPDTAAAQVAVRRRARASEAASEPEGME